MSSGMPELGSKISLISKADIRYEGRLFTVDPQECTIALASVRSFGTEDRETQYPVAPQSQVYDYILFRGSDIKDIRVLNNVPSLPNDPAIMQMSVPPTLGGGAGPGQFAGQFNHPIVGQTQYPQYHPMAGFAAGVHPPINKTSELSAQTSVEMAPQPPAPIGSGVMHHANQVKDQGSMLDLIGGSSQQNASRSGTPAVGPHRKSPTADQGTQQVGSMAGGSGQQRDSRRGSNSAQGPKQSNRNRTNSRTRQRYPSGGQPAPAPTQPAPTQQHHHQPGQGYGRGGGWRGRGRGRGRGFVPRNKNTLKFDNDYDFEQANTEFEELRSQLAKTKISDEVKPEVNVNVNGEVDKKDDSGNETGAGEAEQEDESGAFMGYDKNKSFFDNISCEAVERKQPNEQETGAAPAYDKSKSFFDSISSEAVERSKGRSQRTDWRTERKLNSETFGVAMARRGAWRGRGGWRHNPQHQPWRVMRGGGGRGRAGPALHHQQQHHQQHQQHHQQQHQPRPRNPPHVPSGAAPAQAQPQPASAAAK